MNDQVKMLTAYNYSITVFFVHLLFDFLFCLLLHCISRYADDTMIYICEKIKFCT